MFGNRDESRKRRFKFNGILTLIVIGLWTLVGGASILFSKIAYRSNDKKYGASVSFDEFSQKFTNAYENLGIFDSDKKGPSFSLVSNKKVKIKEKTTDTSREPRKKVFKLNSNETVKSTISYDFDSNLEDTKESSKKIQYTNGSAGNSIGRSTSKKHTQEQIFSKENGYSVAKLDCIELTYFTYGDFDSFDECNSSMSEGAYLTFSSLFNYKSIVKDEHGLGYEFHIKKNTFTVIFGDEEETEITTVDGFKLKGKYRFTYSYTLKENKPSLERAISFQTYSYYSKKKTTEGDDDYKVEYKLSSKEKISYKRLKSVKKENINDYSLMYSLID